MAEPRPITLALQGGGTHGAFTWGVLDRLLEDVEAGEIEIKAISGASAGAINAAVTAGGLAEGGPALARTRLREFWRRLSERGRAGRERAVRLRRARPVRLEHRLEPGRDHARAAGLVVSPYTNPFYSDALAPLLEQSFPADMLERLNHGRGPRLFLSAVNVTTSERKIFPQPHVTIDTLRASLLDRRNSRPSRSTASPIGTAAISAIPR